MRKEQPLIFQLSKEGRIGYKVPEVDVPPLDKLIPQQFLRTTPADLPEVSEIDLVRHFTQLSQKNHGVDSGFYPLGSCTMKYNPKINEDLAALAGLTNLHPYQGDESTQGALKILKETEEFLAEIGGMDRVTLQPAAGAHGELTGLLIIRAYHQSRGDQRKKILVPDSAHGTNPASAALAGFEVVEVPSNAKGCVDIEHLRELVDKETAALMLTNPNTLGIFEENITAIAEIVHQAGGLLYYDGANSNAIMGITRPGDMGFDVMHFNLHKTFATPHGGGGPGSGPVGVKKDLVPFLPYPTVERKEDKYCLDYQRPQSIGKVRSFYGNFSVIVKAYCYLRSLGAEGIKAVSENAVLNANYLMQALKEDYLLPHNQLCKHEFVLSGKNFKEYGVKTTDIAKRLLDFGYHPPTIYFPLIVEEALMIEPTETESKETLDEFIAVMKKIAQEAKENPELLKEGPHETMIGRLDDVLAARKPVLRYQKEK